MAAYLRLVVSHPAPMTPYYVALFGLPADALYNAWRESGEPRAVDFLTAWAAARGYALPSETALAVWLDISLDATHGHEADSERIAQ